MSCATPDELAVGLDDLIRRVPGVSTIYRSASLLSGAVTAAISTFRSAPEDEPLVAVGEDDAGLTISVTIGVEAESATATCRAVHDSIVDYLARSSGGKRLIVKVTVGRVLE